MPEIKRIIYLSETPFSRRDEGRFGLETAARRGFQPEVWELTGLLHPRYEHQDGQVDPPSRFERKRFARKRAVIRALDALTPDTFVVNHLMLGIDTYFLFRALARLRIPYAVVYTNSIPYGNEIRPLSLRRILGRILNGQGRMMIKKAADLMLPRLSFFRSRIEPATFVILGGRQSLPAGNPMIGEKTHRFWTHAMDYDQYLLDPPQPDDRVENTAVFLDEYAPFHPDYYVLRMQNLITPEKYYPALRRVFDHIEDRLGLKVVVAAHPRSDYRSPEALFGPRPVIKGRTRELVKSCRLAIISCSTSINFAVLYRKPIMFITTDEFDLGYRPLVEAMAAYFHRPVVNLDRNIDLSSFDPFAADPADYHKYRDDHIKTAGSPEKPLWDIVCDHLNTLLARTT